MTTLVLGHLVLDEIHTTDGEVYRSPGGITFPLRTFAALAGDDDRIVPVFPFGADARDILSAFDRDSSAVDVHACWEVPQPTTRVRLYHVSPTDYNTRLVTSLESIPRGRFADQLATSDLVYLNMMTGDDITLENAATLRGDGRLVYIDLHMIAYRVHRDGAREPAACPRWKEWIAAGDMVQCNTAEFNALTGADTPLQERIAGVFDGTDLRAFVLTDGERGADVHFADGHVLHAPPVTPARLTDSTGCGDAFGSTFAFGIAAGEDPESAALRAAHAASFVITLAGSEGIGGLGAYLKEVLT